MSNQIPAQPRRIFWYGHHVVLTQTELPRLRSLGFEVFYPPYRAAVYDQSAQLAWDDRQPTSLPNEVFKKLSEYDFFYQPISAEIADILNSYFGTVIVTSSWVWLMSILDVFKGRIIFRVYGQSEALSDNLFRAGYMRKIESHNNFWLVPHAEVALSEEHQWLLERRRVVPYTLVPDVFTIRDTWRDHEDSRVREVMGLCPNIEHPYYRQHLEYLNTAFPGDPLRLYGVQRVSVPDPRIVGTLPRDEYLRCYQRSAAYLYTYREPTVCYLPPIEMMTVGGPVLFMPDSLLARYQSPDAPGLCKSEDEARRKLGLLLEKNQPLISEITESQLAVRNRYAPETVWPIFDRVFRELLDSAPAEHKRDSVFTDDVRGIPPEGNGRRLAIPFMFKESPITFRSGTYEANNESLSRMGRLARAFLRNPRNTAIVSCFPEHLPLAYGFFAGQDVRNQLQILIAKHHDQKAEHDLLELRKKIEKSNGFFDPLDYVTKLIEARLLQSRKQLENKLNSLGQPIRTLRKFLLSSSLRGIRLDLFAIRLIGAVFRALNRALTRLEARNVHRTLVRVPKRKFARRMTGSADIIWIYDKRLFPEFRSLGKTIVFSTQSEASQGGWRRQLRYLEEKRLRRALADAGVTEGI